MKNMICILITCAVLSTGSLYAEEVEKLTQSEIQSKYKVVDGDTIAEKISDNNNKISQDEFFEKYNIIPCNIPKGSEVINFTSIEAADKFLQLISPPQTVEVDLFNSFENTEEQSSVLNDISTLCMNPVKFLFNSVEAAGQTRTTYQERVAYNFGLSKIKIGAYISWDTSTKKITRCKAHMFHEGFTFCLKFSQRYAYGDPEKGKNHTIVRGGGDLEYCIFINGIGTIITRFCPTHFKYIVK